MLFTGTQTPLGGRPRMPQGFGQPAPRFLRHYPTHSERQSPRNAPRIPPGHPKGLCKTFPQDSPKGVGQECPQDLARITQGRVYITQGFFSRSQIRLSLPSARLPQGLRKATAKICPKTCPRPPRFLVKTSPRTLQGSRPRIPQELAQL